jgi:DNA-directed RNA polymerase subunit D
MRQIEKKENQLVFEAEISETLANAIRRYINQIPVLAVDEVEISRNDSPLYDETIAHRIGLIPLKTEKIGKDKIKKLKLNVKREGNVFSGDLNGGVKIIYPEIPITSLSKGQELELVAIPKLGKGTEHSKFSPGLIFYRNSSEIILDKNLLDQIEKLSIKNEIKEKGNKIVILDNKKEEISDVCEGVCNRHGKKAEINPKKELIITLESFGQISVEDMFKQSIEGLKKDLSTISKKIDKA